VIDTGASGRGAVGVLLSCGTNLSPSTRP